MVSRKFYFLSWFLVLTTLAYFSYHIYHGDRGLIAQDELVSKHKKLSLLENELETKKNELKRKIDGLDDVKGKIDKDFLEEEARKLGYAYKNEFVIHE